ncbi:MAG: hypothetical protein Q9224_002808 [Gallowayella concinna]
MEDAHPNGHNANGRRKQQSFLMRSIEDWTTLTFLIPQGSGVLATVLFQLNWQFQGSQIIATILWLYTILIFSVLSLIYITKICLFPQTVRKQLTSDIMELCNLSSVSITFGVIINMVALVCAKAWGPSWGMVAYVLSWINVFIAFVVVVGIPYVYFRCCPPGTDNMPPAVILPVISALTASSACGIVCYAGKLSARAQLPMIITGYVLLGIGYADTAALIIVYLTRLINGGFPNKAQLWMNFIPVGPLGQASVAMQILGQAASAPGHLTFASYNEGTFITASAGQVLGTMGTFMGLLTWSYAAWWLLFAIALTIHLGIFADGGIREYSLSAWSTVFPWKLLQKLSVAMVSVVTEPPKDPNEPLSQGNSKEAGSKSLENSSKPPEVQKSNNQSAPTPNNVKNSSKDAADEKAEKASGVELKKRAKAEKAAKRAQSKQEQQAPQHTSTNDKATGAGNHVRKDSTSQSQVPNSPKGQHKRAGSLSASVQKPLSLRPGQQHAPVPEPEPKKENKKVAFLTHLYGTPRRTSIAGAGKDVHPSTLALGLQMSHYTICGSNARCVSTLLVFKRVIDAYATPPGTSLPRHLTLHLSTQIDYLVSCRPLSISMGNAIRWLKMAISTIDPDTPEHQAKTELCSAIDNFIRERITVAGQAIASSASARIQDGDVILTFAKSSIVERTLAEAYRQGKRFRVIVVDSGPLYEGRNLTCALSNLGLEVQYAASQCLSHVIQDATKVFLGAHAMMSNGGLYSRTGTALVAMMAKDVDIPVLVLCESVKFSDKVALDSIASNEIAPPHELGFPGTSNRKDDVSPDDWRDAPNLMGLNLMYDLTPADYIHMIITEYGSLPPSSVPVVQRLSTNT